MPWKAGFVSGHDFSRAADAAKYIWALAPEGCFSLRRLVLFIILLSALTTSAAAQSAGEKSAYLDSTLPISVRVDDLMKRMTLKETIGQLNLPCVYVDELGKTVDEKTEAVRKFAAGTHTSEIGPGAGFFTLADTLRQKDLAWQVNYFNELQKIATTQTRLKIPLLQDEEGTHGAMFPNATVFPEGLAIGSTAQSMFRWTWRTQVNAPARRSRRCMCTSTTRRYRCRSSN